MVNLIRDWLQTEGLNQLAHRNEVMSFEKQQQKAERKKEAVDVGMLVEA